MSRAIDALRRVVLTPFVQPHYVGKLMKLKSPSAATLAVSVALGASGILSTVCAQSALPAATASVTPNADAFYKSPSASELASTQPGDVLRYRPAPQMANLAAVSDAYQLMYRSTNSQGIPSASVTTVIIPKQAPSSGRKLMAFQSFYDSLTLSCSPSYLSVKGKLFQQATNVLPALKKGIVVVMSDYEGLESQWIAGKNTGQGVLDGIRAVLRFDKAGLDGAAPVAMVGFSGGGHATGWAAEMAPEYAPELNIVGAAMGGVPVMVGNVAKKVDGGLFAGVFLGAVVGLSRAYPELDPKKYATPAGLIAVQDMGTRCLLGMFEGQNEMLLKYAFKKSTRYLKDPNFLNLPEIAAMTLENSMTTRIPTTPVYVYEGTTDEIMPIADVDNLVKRYCDAGVKVQYNRTTGDHLLMGTNPTPMLNYVLDRLDGKAAPSNCK